MNRWLPSLAALAAVSLGVLAVTALAGGREEMIRGRLGAYVKGRRFVGEAAPEQQNRRRQPRSHKNGARWASLERSLAEADWPLRAQEFLLLQVASGLLLALLLGAVQAWLAPFGLLGGPALARLALSQAQARRLANFNEQLVDVLEVMANSLRSGFSFFQSMEMVADETPPPLGREFTRLLKELALGTPTEEGLLRLSERVRSRDLELMITAVLIQRQVGGNLAEVLERIVHTIRERVRIRGEVKTLTAQGRISGLLVGLLPFALVGVLALLNPEYIGMLIREPLGRLLAGAGLFSEAMGALIIRRMVKVDY